MHDVLIKNGFVLDGTGSPQFLADIAIKDGKIVTIGSVDEASAANIIDASDKFVSPGFIDSHGHSDVISWASNDYDVKLRQGVTTEVIGSCGLSLAPCNDKRLKLLDEYLETIECGNTLHWEWRTFQGFVEFLSSQELSTNLVPFVGHGTIRIAVMGFDNRVPSRNELEEMKALVREAMEAGAYGLSSGLVYPPGAYSSTDELTELCKVVSEYNGIYSTHMRNESNDLIEAAKEAIEIAETTNTKLLISHLKVMGRRNWGKVKEAIRLIEGARERGVRIWVDQYPYTANSTFLHALVPPDEISQGIPALIENLKNKDKCRTIINKIEHDHGQGWENFVAHAGGWSGVRVLSVPATSEWEGKLISEIANETGISPGEVFCQLLIKNEGRGMVVTYTMSEEDVKQILKTPFQVVGSDGLPGEGGVHPRLYGTFPRLIAKYVRDEKVISLPEAIRKMTGEPAKLFGLERRGVIREGNVADITVFDFERIEDLATYQSPNEYPSGIDWVLIGGEIVVKDGNVIKWGQGKVII